MKYLNRLRPRLLHALVFLGVSVLSLVAKAAPTIDIYYLYDEFDVCHYYYQNASNSDWYTCDNDEVMLATPPYTNGPDLDWTLVGSSAPEGLRYYFTILGSDDLIDLYSADPETSTWTGDFFGDEGNDPDFTYYDENTLQWYYYDSDFYYFGYYGIPVFAANTDLSGDYLIDTIGTPPVIEEPPPHPTIDIYYLYDEFDVCHYYYLNAFTSDWYTCDNDEVMLAIPPYFNGPDLDWTLVGSTEPEGLRYYFTILGSDDTIDLYSADPEAATWTGDFFGDEGNDPDFTYYDENTYQWYYYDSDFYFFGYHGIPVFAANADLSGDYLIDTIGGGE